MLTAIDLAEMGGVGDADQASRQIVAPAVIGADEGALVGAARLLLDGGAAMAADVEKGAQHPIGAAHHQDRLAGVVVGDEVAGFAQLARESHHDGMLAEQEIDFALEADRIVIFLDRGVADTRPIVACVGADHTQHTLKIGDLIGVFHRALLDRVPAV